MEEGHFWINSGVACDVEKAQTQSLRGKYAPTAFHYLILKNKVNYYKKPS
jgi:hypothetical protein